VVAFDHDREAVVERIERAGLDRHVALIVDRERRDRDAARGSGGCVGRDGRRPLDGGAGNERGIEADGRLHVLLEPEMLRDFRHGGRPYCLRGPTRPNVAPCGSSAMTMKPPPGTSAGPWRIAPPLFMTARAAASMSSTPK